MRKQRGGGVARYWQQEAKWTKYCARILKLGKPIPIGITSK